MENKKQFGCENIVGAIKPASLRMSRKGTQQQNGWREEDRVKVERTYLNKLKIRQKVAEHFESIYLRKDEFENVENRSNRRGEDKKLLHFCREFHFQQYC